MGIPVVIGSSGIPVVPVTNGAPVSVAENGYGTPVTLSTTGTPVTGLFVDETMAVIARMTTSPTPTRAYAMDTLVRALKTGGIWAKLDCLYVMAAHDAQAARLNWIADAYNLTAVASPTFTADQGYAGDGSTAYLRTGFTPSTAGGKYLRDSAHVSVWCRNNVQSGSYFDVAGGAVLNTRSNNADAPRAALNDVTLVNYGSAIGSSIGHFILNRSGASALQCYRNGSSIGTNTTASVGIFATVIDLMGSGSNSSTRQQAAMSIGSSLTAGEATAFHAALSAYLTSVGAA